MNREDGYYWVQDWVKKGKKPRWEVGHFVSDKWFIDGCEIYGDLNFIGERIPEPEEES